MMRALVGRGRVCPTELCTHVLGIHHLEYPTLQLALSRSHSLFAAFTLEMSLYALTDTASLHTL